MDFFTVPTVTFRVLYGLFVIEHERRKILHCNVTQHPTAEWIVQQLREAFPEPCRHQYVILDCDRKFDTEVLAFLAAAGVNAKRTSVRAPWQNGLAERWIESCRREILDHVMPSTRSICAESWANMSATTTRIACTTRSRRTRPTGALWSNGRVGMRRSYRWRGWVRLDYITVTLGVSPRRRKSRFSGRAEHRCLA